MIYTEARNAEGGEGAKHMDAMIRVQKGLAALNHQVLKQSNSIGLTIVITMN